MKKGKKGLILLMAFTTWTVLITGCGKWLGNKPDTMPEDTTVGADTENTENLDAVWQMSDGEAIRKLSSLKGIGVWTEEISPISASIPASMFSPTPLISSMPSAPSAVISDGIPKKGGHCSFYLQTSNKSRF